MRLQEAATEVSLSSRVKRLMFNNTELSHLFSFIYVSKR